MIFPVCHWSGLDGDDPANDVYFGASSRVAGGASGTDLSWSHNPSGDPDWVLILVYGNAPADLTLPGVSVTYGGETVNEVLGGLAQESGSEPGCCKAFFLAGGLPAGSQTVFVDNPGDQLWAACVSGTADGTPSVHTAGIVLLEGSGSLSEQNVSDGGGGGASLRIGGLFSGLASPPAAGANSTVIQSQDDGSQGFSVVRENSTGSGSRLVGWSSGSTDERAGVLLAIKST